MTSLALAVTKPPVYAALLDALDRIEAQRVALREAEENLYVLARERLPELSIETAAQIYWDWPELPPTLLATAFGLTPGRMAKIAGPRPVDVLCPSCGDQFVVRASSRTDYQHWKSQGGSCKRCRPDWRYGSDPRLPGRRTGQRLSELRAMPYAEYLRTPEWAETRDKALALAHHSCQLCSSKYALTVHHRTYDRFGTEQPRDLIVLCRDCHKLFHAHRRLTR